MEFCMSSQLISLPKEKNAAVPEREAVTSSQASYHESVKEGAHEPADTSILGRIASGDEAAVQDCMDKYGGLIWALARRLSPNSEEAEDAVQEIFIDSWKSAARFDAPENFRWAMRSSAS